MEGCAWIIEPAVPAMANFGMDSRFQTVFHTMKLVLSWDVQVVKRFYFVMTSNGDFMQELAK